MPETKIIPDSDQHGIERLRDLLRDQDREGWLSHVAADEITDLRSHLARAQEALEYVATEPCRRVEAGYLKCDPAECSVCCAREALAYLKGEGNG